MKYAKVAILFISGLFAVAFAGYDESWIRLIYSQVVPTTITVNTTLPQAIDFTYAFGSDSASNKLYTVLGYFHEY